MYSAKLSNLNPNIPYTPSTAHALHSFCIQVRQTIINEFRCYKAKIEKSEKAGSHRESKPGYLWLELPLFHLYFWLITPNSFFSSMRQDALSKTDRICHAQYSNYNVHCSHPQHNSLSMHINMNRTTHYTAFHNLPLHTTNKHKV